MRRAYSVLVRGLLVTAPAVVFCAMFVDRPLAIFIHEHLAFFRPLRHLLDLTIIVSPLLLIYMLIYAVRRSVASTTRPAEWHWFIIATTYLVGLETKYMLKLAFGRTWPRIMWPNRYDLLLMGTLRGPDNGGLYGFYPFVSTDPFTAFPSGSSVVTVSLATQVWFLFPRLRSLMVLLVASQVAAGLLSNTHFVGDIIAGVYVGLVVGLYGLALFPLRLPVPEVAPAVAASQPAEEKAEALVTV